MFSSIFMGLLPGIVFYFIVRKHMLKKDADHCATLILILIFIYLLIVDISLSILFIPINKI
jgi:hypothetical protein